MANRFEDLLIWQKARDLTRLVYDLTKVDAFSRDFGLRDQIRKAAISVMSNIAEGFERDSDAQFAHFLTIAKGSCGEVRSQLYVALDQGYVGQRSWTGRLKAQRKSLECCSGSPRRFETMPDDLRTGTPTPCTLNLRF